MKVLFLDIDGVVNKKENFDPAKNLGPFPIDAYCAFLVGRIQLETGCEVVLSSSWRHLPEAVEVVSQRVVKLLDVTGTALSGFRGNEILYWLSRHPEVTRHAILDDESDFRPDQPLFQTTFNEGLTDEIARKVIMYLNA